MAELGRYKSKKEKIYSKKMNSLLKKVKPYFVAQNPFLFTSRQLVTEMITRTMIFQKVEKIQGNIVECGSFQGNNLMLFAHLSSIFEPYSFNRKLYSFDTFNGFRSINKKNDPKDISKKSFSNVDLKILKKSIELYNINRAVSHVNKIHLIKGDATKTIPKFMKNRSDFLISILYLDFDLFEPTKIALENFAKSVVKGGIIVFDQVNYEKFGGETIAFKQYFNVNKIKLEKFNHDPFVGYVVL